MKWDIFLFWFVISWWDGVITGTETPHLNHQQHLMPTWMREVFVPGVMRMDKMVWRTQKTVFFLSQINKMYPLVFCFKEQFQLILQLKAAVFTSNCYNVQLGSHEMLHVRSDPSYSWTKILLRSCIEMFSSDVISARHVVSVMTPQLCLGDKEAICRWPDSLM